MVLSLLMALNATGTLSVGASALEDAQLKKESGNDEKSGDTTRTVMLFLVGADLEVEGACATNKLIQVMEAEYDENVNVIAVTGGSPVWHAEAEYLEGAEAIEPMLNQVWKVEGKKEGEKHGKMTLIEPEGLPGFEDTLISQPEALTAFIDYCYDNYKSDLYDIIMMDHGGGPAGGYGIDIRYTGIDNYFDIVDLMKGFGDSELINDGQKFEVLDFDACLMSNVEIVTALYDFADNLVLSSDVEYSPGQYLTPVFNDIRENPSMNGFKIGKSIVDSMVEYDKNFYGENSIVKATLSVIDTDNYKKRLADKLERFDDILISEAKNAGENGEINFYDEFMSLYNTIEFSDSNLFDLGGLVGSFSAPNVEADNTSDKDYEARQNEYTTVAKEILSVLNDQDGSGDDVLYSGCSESYIRKYYAYNCGVRGIDGELTETDDAGYMSVSPTGLSIYYGFTKGVPTIYYDTLNYMAQMYGAILNTDDSATRTHMLKRLNAVMYYKLISMIGCAVSTLKSEGVETIDLETVKAYLNAQDQRWDYDIDYYLLYLLKMTGEFGSNEEAYEYISKLIDQQQKDYAAPEDISAKKVILSDGSSYYYRVDFKNCFAKAFKTLTSSIYMQIKDPFTSDFQNITDNYYQKHMDLEELFPGGIWITMYADEGYVDLGSAIKDFDPGSIQSVKKFYQQDSFACTLKEQKPYALALTDSSGKQHVISEVFNDDTNRLGYVPVIIKLSNGVYKNAALNFEANEAEDGLVFTSVSVLNDQDVFYYSYDFDDEIWEGASFAPYTNLKNTKGNMQPVPLDSFTKIDNTKERWGLSLDLADYSEISDNNFELIYDYEDIYGVKHSLNDVIAEADEKAANGDVVYSIDDAEVTVGEAVYDGTEQKPKVTVTLDGKELKEGVDYNLFYDGSTGPGTAMIEVIGIGDYEGYTFAEYDIICPHFFELKNTVPATCTEKGYAEYECPVCGETKTEEIEPLGHDWSEWVVTKEPTETEQGEKKRVCSRCGEEETEILPAIESKTDIADTRIYISDYKQPYTGDTVKPKVVVFYRGKRLVEGKDYELSYENAVDPGKAAVNITGIGKFTGTVTGEYYVTPAKVELNNVTSDTRGTLDVSWTNDGMTDGYEILLYSSRSRGFTNTITRFKTNGDESSMKIANLRAGSRCTVFIRSYKIIDGKPVYSKFTASQSVTIKGYNFGFNWGSIFGWSLFRSNPFNWL